VRPSYAGLFADGRALFESPTLAPYEALGPRGGNDASQLDGSRRRGIRPTGYRWRPDRVRSAGVDRSAVCHGGRDRSPRAREWRALALRVTGFQPAMTRYLAGLWHLAVLGRDDRVVVGAVRRRDSSQAVCGRCRQVRFEPLAQLRDGLAVLDLRISRRRF